MKDWIGRGDGVDIVFVAPPRLVEATAGDIGAGTVNISVGPGAIEENQIRGSTKSVACYIASSVQSSCMWEWEIRTVYLEMLPDPDMPVPFAGMVERWERTDTGEQRARGSCKCMEEKVVYGGRENIARCEANGEGNENRHCRR